MNISPSLSARPKRAKAKISDRTTKRDRKNRKGKKRNVRKSL